MAPTISSPVCQEQLIEAGKLVAKSAEGCVEASKAATNDDQLLKQVGVAATAVTQALNDLLQHIKQHALGGQPIGRYDQATDTILNVTENIFSSMGDAGEMVRQARILAQATSDLVNAIKADAEGETDLENSRKLLSAAKILADATAKMVEAAKVSGMGEDGHWLWPPDPDAISSLLQRSRAAPGWGSVSQSRVLHQAEGLCSGVGLLLELRVVAEELLTLLLLSSPGEALGISTVGGQTALGAFPSIRLEHSRCCRRTRTRTCEV